MIIARSHIFFPFSFPNLQSYFSFSLSCSSNMRYIDRVGRFFERHKDRISWFLILGLLGTWSHFLDSPSGFSETATREDPRLVFRLQARMRDFSFFLIVFLLLRFFVYLLVFILAVVLGVYLFVHCFASACKWRLFWSHGRTTTYMVLLLIPALDATRIGPVCRGKSTPSLYSTVYSLPECGDFAITAPFQDTRRMEIPSIHLMLLDMVQIAR